LVDPGADDWYLCGPAAAVTGWRSTLLAADVPADRIHRELFHTGPDLAMPRQASPTAAGVLTITLDDRTTQTSFAPADTVLEAVLRARPEAPFACRGGICGTCRAMLVTGEVAMDANFALEADELDRGFVLTCQARPTTASVTVDYDSGAR
jgi:ring-1,2-phenylacetyl-CoA epoxidase subunit PaaE